jgi:hypothetical protein
MADPTLDGSIPGSGSVTMSSGDSGDTYAWALDDNDLYRVAYTGASAACITGTINGSLTVAPGQIVCLDGARVNGGLTVQSGGTLEMTGSTINGGLTASGATSVDVCANRINGPTSVQNSSGSVIIGGQGGPACAPNSLNGPVTLADNSAGVELIGNTINGPVTVRNNTGYAPEIAGNTINGPLACSGDVPTATNDGQRNTVHGPESGECAGF